MGIEILNGGMLTTIQDAGRYGYQQFGVTVSGSMDVYHHNLANILVGNNPGCEVLEATILPPSLHFTQDNLFALCGAPVSGMLAGEPIEMNRAYLAHAGDTLMLTAATHGCRTYLAFAGGLDVPAVMGSKSTFLKGRIGGLNGRALQKGDFLGFCAPRTTLPNLAFRTIHESMIHDFAPAQTIRVIPGPQIDAFSGEGVSTFLNTTYTVTQNADRMGYRLDGARIEHAPNQDGNIISDAITKGAIQVPGHGQPIIMMADRQTTGGYAKIGHVISVDLPRVAQLRPGDSIRFALCDVQEAQSYANQRTQQLRTLRRILDQETILSAREYHVLSAFGERTARIERIVD